MINAARCQSNVCKMWIYIVWRIIVYTSDAPGTLILRKKKCFQRLSKGFFGTARISELIWKWVPDNGSRMSNGQVCCVGNVVRPAGDCAERSRWRPAMADTATHQSDRNCGALLYKHRWLSHRACNEPGGTATSSQCRLASYKLR